MIQLLRVDHRLLHGQVVFSWCGQLNPNCILIANDAAATDGSMQNTVPCKLRQLEQMNNVINIIVCFVMEGSLCPRGSISPN